MKFLHCADLHLDSPLRGLSAYEGAPAAEIRAAARHAFDNAVQLAVDEQVSCVVIAGDLYDGDREDFNTAAYLQRQFHRLDQAGIAVVVVSGNHDAENEITRRLAPPDNVRVLRSDIAETVEPEGTGLAVHGQSYATKVVDVDLAAHYPPPAPDLLNIGLLHTSLEGREGPHARYAPCTETSLADRGYQYWALGHIHERYETQRSGVWIVYPGNLQGRHARECGEKGATLVTYDGADVIAVEHRVLDVVRWERCEVEIADGATSDDVVAEALGALGRLADSAGSRLLVARVVVRGVTSTAADLARDRVQWEAQLRTDAGGADGHIWIEQVQLAVTEPVARDEEALGQAMGAVRALLRRAESDEQVQADLARCLGDLRAKLTADLPALADLGFPSLEPDGIVGLLPAVELEILAALGMGGAR